MADATWGCQGMVSLPLPWHANHSQNKTTHEPLYAGVQSTVGQSEEMNHIQILSCNKPHLISFTLGLLIHCVDQRFFLTKANRTAPLTVLYRLPLEAVS